MYLCTLNSSFWDGLLFLVFFIILGRPFTITITLVYRMRDHEGGDYVLYSNTAKSARKPHFMRTDRSLSTACYRARRVCWCAHRIVYPDDTVNTADIRWGYIYYRRNLRARALNLVIRNAASPLPLFLSDDNSCSCIICKSLCKSHSLET